MFGRIPKSSDNYSFIDRELRRIAADQCARAAPFGLIAGLLAVLRLWTPERLDWIVPWVAGMAVITIMRLFLPRWLSAGSAGRERFVIPLLFCAAFSSGLLWAVAPLVFGTTYGTVSYYELIVLLAGVNVGGCIAFSIYLPSYLAFAMPIVAAIVVPNFEHGSGMQFMAAVIGFFFFTYFVSKAYRDLIAERTNAIAALQSKEAEALRLADQAMVAAEAKSRFLATMSHEIRTPLNGLLGMAQLMREEPLSTAQEHRVATILSAGGALHAILCDLLDMSKIEAGRMDMKPVPMNLARLLEQVCDTWMIPARERGLECSLSFDPYLPERLVFDPVRVQQCVGNLLSNAVKFTHEGGVRIGATATAQPETGDYLIRITVSDSGIGVETEQQERIFEDFFQSDSSTDRLFSGTGLGLPITRKLARMMGGDVVCVTHPGHGSTFVLTFLAAVAGSADDAKGQSNLKAAAAWPELRGVQVLLVDDNVINRKVASAFLESEGVAATAVESGAEALSLLLAGERFDLALVDMRMPVMDGPETVRQIRSMPGPDGQLPIIAVTADVTVGSRERYLALGIDGYVSKPFDKAQLLTEVHTVIGNRSVIHSGEPDMVS
jgi:signal transduction histidine kinase/CheY-like chemotaxis protein